MAVTKSKGRYFTDTERVWEESNQLGAPPFNVGQWKGQYQLPERPSPEGIKPLFEGHGLARVQKNRVGCFDLTFTASKSVSIALFALAPTKEWKVSANALAKAASTQLEPLLKDLKINSGAQGTTKLIAQGVAVGFVHFRSFAGMPHAHVHVAVPNLAVAANGKTGSIANAKQFFEMDGAMRAGFQKDLDDHCQRQGYRTARVGKRVEVVGIPAKLVAEFSPARAAINEARKQTGFSGPRAADFFARQARREVPKGQIKSPEEHRVEWVKAAKSHGVTRKTLRGSEDNPLISDPAINRYVAFCTAKDAVASCTKRYGTFTAGQYREELYLTGIGRPTTRNALDEEASKVLNRPKYAGVERMKLESGQERFGTRAGFKKHRVAEKHYAQEAFDDLKNAFGHLAKTVLLKTASSATAALKKIADAINPVPTVIRIDGRDADRFLASHTPTAYFKSHAKALLSGFFAPGNPHERAAVAEREYKRLRNHDRLSSRTILLIDNADSLTPRQLGRLAKLAQRDKSSVVLARANTSDFNREQTRRSRSSDGRYREHHL